MEKIESPFYSVAVQCVTSATSFQPFPSKMPSVHSKPSVSHVADIAIDERIIAIMKMSRCCIRIVGTYNPQTDKTSLKTIDGGILVNPHRADPSDDECKLFSAAALHIVGEFLFKCEDKPGDYIIPLGKGKVSIRVLPDRSSMSQVDFLCA